MSTTKLHEEIQEGRFEETPEGLYIPRTDTLVQGVFSYSKRGEQDEFSCNQIVIEGLNHILSVVLKGATPNSNWFIAPFSGDVVVQSTWTAANFASTSTEVTAYESASRPAWAPGSVSNGEVDSYAAKAEIKATQNSVVIRGAALLSSSTKGGSVGTLLGASRFASAKTLDEGEILDIGYGIKISAAT